jgi:PKD repeat protein
MNSHRSTIIAIAIYALASASQHANAQNPPRSLDQQMGGCHEGLAAVEKAVRSVDDPIVKADIGVIIDEMYRATDLDDGQRCLELIETALRILESGPLVAPAAAFTWYPLSPPYYTLITFDASISTDADGEIRRYLWDLGDGTKAEGAIVEHVYRQNGNFTIRLTVVDNDGLTHSKKVDLPVTDTYR